MSSSVSARIVRPYMIAARDFDRNGPQKQAYDSKGHCVVLAGPGSGKTKVLTTKFARLLSEDLRPPRGIACVTYNNECARELVRRLERLGVRASGNVFVGTVHSFCLKAILAPYARLSGVRLADPVRVASTTEQDIAFQRALTKVVSANENPNSWRPRCDSFRRNALDRSSPAWKDEGRDEAKVVAEYERILHAAGLIDFDDMVFLGLRLVERHAWVRKALHARYPILVVDEYQDLGLALHQIVLALCFAAGPSCRLFAVGDADQSIYGFTGARPELLKGLAEDERVESVRLRLNYRSRSSIVAASEVVLGEERGYVSASGDGGLIDFHECPGGLQDQAATVCRKLIPDAIGRGAARNLGQVAVLYQDKNVGDVISDSASECGLEYLRIDRNGPYPKTPMTRWLEECASWCAGGWRSGQPPLSALIGRWLAFHESARTDEAVLRQTRRLMRFLWSHREPAMPLKAWLSTFGVSCLEELLRIDLIFGDEAEVFNGLIAACDGGGRMADWTLQRFGGQGGSPDHLNLMTLHSAKGLEFDVVLMIGLDQGNIPRYSQKTPESKRESRRLFYVGLTRARHEVHLIYSGWRESYGRRYNEGPSEFVLEVMDSLR